MVLTINSTFQLLPDQALPEVHSTCLKNKTNLSPKVIGGKALCTPTEHGRVPKCILCANLQHPLGPECWPVAVGNLAFPEHLQMSTCRFPSSMAAGTTLPIRCGQLAVNGLHLLSLANAAKWAPGKFCGFVRRVTRLPLCSRSVFSLCPVTSRELPVHAWHIPSSTVAWSSGTPAPWCVF